MMMAGGVYHVRKRRRARGSWGSKREGKNTRFRCVAQLLDGKLRLGGTLVGTGRTHLRSQEGGWVGVLDGRWSFSCVLETRGSGDDPLSLNKLKPGKIHVW